MGVNKIVCIFATKQNKKLMETLSLTRLRANVSAALNRVDEGQDVMIKSKNRLYKIVPVEDKQTDITPELQKRIDRARRNHRNGNVTCCNNLQELHSFLDSL